jgi:hypothetical protein
MVTSENRARELLLYSGLIAIFLAAAISDRWPQISYLAISGGLAFVVCEVAAIYVLSRRSARRIAQSGFWKQMDASAAEVLIHSASKHLALYEPASALMYLSHSHHVSRQRRTDTLKAFEFAIANLERSMPHSHIDFIVSGSRGRGKSHLVPTELAKWAVAVQGQEAFSVKAGSFEIEHFHGRTNIKILDPSVVTVEVPVTEGGTQILPPEIRPPTYQ